MLCQQCSQKTTIQCCSTILLCAHHYTEHFAHETNHKPQQLLSALDPIDQSILNSELQNRISSLEKMIEKTATYTKSLKCSIKSLRLALTNKINKMIQNYQKILNTQDFYYLDELKEILKTEMIVKDFSFENLITEINELFTRDLIIFDIDLDKKRAYS